MPRYQHSHSYHHQTRFITRVRKIIIITILVFVLAVIIVLIDSWREGRQATTPADPSQETSATFQPSFQVFTSDYFQFQAGRDWKHIANESSNTRFVYRSFRGALVERNMTVAINPTTSPEPTTRVLPVQLSLDNQLLPKQVSKHCRQSLPGNGPLLPQAAEMGGVRFLCNPDGTDYSVQVGMIGGSAPMLITRPNGQSATYSVTYQDVTAHPNDKELQEILKTFQIR